MLDKPSDRLYLGSTSLTEHGLLLAFGAFLASTSTCALNSLKVSLEDSYCRANPTCKRALWKVFVFESLESEHPVLLAIFRHCCIAQIIVVLILYLSEFGIINAELTIVQQNIILKTRGDAVECFEGFFERENEIFLLGDIFRKVSSVERGEPINHRFVGDRNVTLNTVRRQTEHFVIV